MIDYDIYNERRQQLCERFGNIQELMDIMYLSTEDIIDLVDWEDNANLAEEMGWTEDDEGGSGQ